eukprot:scaffold9396_cov100-Isochrysis_galbana.AAC.6
MPAVPIGVVLLLASTAAQLETSPAPDPITGHGRELLLTQGCTDCCFAGNCREAFNGLPGVCCSRQTPGCCPIGSQCVKCAMKFVCSTSAYLTKRDRCNMCAQRGDTPVDCMGSEHGTVGAIIFFVLLIVLTATYDACGRAPASRGQPASLVNPRHANVPASAPRRSFTQPLGGNGLSPLPSRR